MAPRALWIACLPGENASAPEPAGPWLSAYGEHPCPLEDGWVLDLSRSERLFGGRKALLQRLHHEGTQNGWRRLGAAPTALAALALARHTPTTGGWQSALGTGWSDGLDGLPTDRLGAARSHHDVLQALGLRTLGDLRRCPRVGLARRTGPALLDALDALYGRAAPALTAWSAAERFRHTLELPAPTSEAGALLFAAQRLLDRLARWLQQRQAGVLHWRLGWQGLPPEAALDFRHREPMQDAPHLRRLLHQTLQHTTLPQAVDGLWLETLATAPRAPASASLLPGRPAADALDWDALVERLTARLGETRVQTVHRTADWHPDRRQQWRPATAREAVSAPPPADALAALAGLWEPPWRLPQARPLETDSGGRPRLDGQPLRRLAGPQRIATGWWETPVTLDICVAATPDGRCWWLHRVRGTDTPEPAPWRLAGVYT